MSIFKPGLKSSKEKNVASIESKNKQREKIGGDAGIGNDCFVMLFTLVEMNEPNRHTIEVERKLRMSIK